MSDRLLRLTAHARSLIRGETRTGAAGRPWSPDTEAAVTALAEHLIGEGVERRLAEYAVTRWVVTERPIRECVAEEQERFERDGYPGEPPDGTRSGGVT